MKNILAYLFAAILLLSAVGHIATPEVYSAMIPSFINETFANVATAIAEFLVAIVLIIPKYRAYGGLGFMLLMIAFIPIHVLDLFRDEPAIGAPPLPIIRFVFQFVLIYAGWRIYKRTK